MAMKKPGAVTVIGVVFLGFGVLLFVDGLGPFLAGGASLEWPTIEGEVISSEIVTNGGRRTVKYRAAIQYEYSVNGRKYSSDKVTIMPTKGTRDKAQRQVNKYPVGKTISVHYDPNEPEFAVLEPGRTGYIYLPFILGAVFATIGLCVLFAGIRSLRRGR